MGACVGIKKRHTIKYGTFCGDYSEDQIEGTLIDSSSGENEPPPVKQHIYNGFTQTDNISTEKVGQYEKMSMSQHSPKAEEGDVSLLGSVASLTFSPSFESLSVTTISLEDDNNDGDKEKKT